MNCVFFFCLFLFVGICSFDGVHITHPSANQIKSQQYDEAMRFLEKQLESSPQSRPALSLMAYCAYHMQDFATAVEW